MHGNCQARPTALQKAGNARHMGQSGRPQAVSNGQARPTALLKAGNAKPKTFCMKAAVKPTARASSTCSCARHSRAGPSMQSNSSCGHAFQCPPRELQRATSAARGGTPLLLESAELRPRGSPPTRKGRGARIQRASCRPMPLGLIAGRMFWRIARPIFVRGEDLPRDQRQLTGSGSLRPRGLSVRPKFR